MVEIPIKVGREEIRKFQREDFSAEASLLL